MCNFIPKCTDIAKLLVTLYELLDLPPFHMQEDGYVIWPGEMFEKPTMVKLSELPNHTLDDTSMMELLLGNVLSIEQCKMMGSGLSIAPGKILYNNELMFELELCEGKHRIRLDNPVGEPITHLINMLRVGCLTATAIEKEFFSVNDALNQIMIYSTPDSIAGRKLVYSLYNDVDVIDAVKDAVIENNRLGEHEKTRRGDLDTLIKYALHFAKGDCYFLNGKLHCKHGEVPVSFIQHMVNR